MPEFKFCLLDIDYVLDEQRRPIIRIFGKTDKGDSVVALDKSFEPYFYAVAEDLEDAEKDVKGLKSESFKIEKVKVLKRFYKNREMEILKIFTRAPPEVPAAREAVKALKSVYDVYEADILFTQRYVIDKGLVPMSMVKVKGKKVESELVTDLCIELEGGPEVTDEPLPKLKIMSFDIEVFNPKGMPQADRDPIIMLSAASDGFEKISASSPDVCIPMSFWKFSSCRIIHFFASLRLTISHRP